MKEVKVESSMPDGGDPGLRVYVTDDEELHCFRLEFDGPEGTLEVALHARTLLDLQARLGSAWLIWQLDALNEVLGL